MATYDLNQIDTWQEPQEEQTSGYRISSGIAPEPITQEPMAPQQAAPAAAPEEEMAGRGRLILLTVLAVLLVLSLMAEPFLVYRMYGTPASVVDSRINEYGELVIYYSDGTSQNVGTVVSTDNNGGSNSDSGSSDVAAAAAKGLRSAVSVWCTFREEEGSRGGGEAYYSTGSGVIYQLDKEQGDAFIITNYHVVFDADSRADNGIAEEIVLYLYGGHIEGKEILATYVGGSQNYDIAVLRVEDSQILMTSAAEAVTVADSDRVTVGSTAIAVGNPEGNGLSASSGVVSVDSEYITMTAMDGYTEVSYRVMRIDTAVNSGNSGGGLFDDQGRLIGIVNAKTMEEGVENIGYALPSSSVVAVADNIIDYCFGTDCESVQRAIMGITVRVMDSSAVYDAVTNSVRVVETVQIYEVTPGQIGSAFQVGDVLVSVTLGDRTKTITRQHHVIDMMMTARPGDEAVFEVMRDGQVITVAVTLTEDCLTAY